MTSYTTLLIWLCIISLSHADDVSFATAEQIEVCTYNETMCYDMCLPKCDGNFDCDDCSDEIDCDPYPFHRVFQCKDKQGCVTLGNRCTGDLECNFFCDGPSDCEDGSDEPRGGLGFKCPIDRTDNKYRHQWCAVPQEYIVRWRNITDREQGIDYRICEQEEDLCFENGFLNTKRCLPCIDGTIISTAQLCDGKLDCPDASDECLCDKTQMDQKLARFCRNHLKFGMDCSGIRCLVSDRNFACIAEDLICDGRSDCVDNLDEEFCRKSETEGMKICSDSKTNKAVYCDGRPECFDLSDECLAECEKQYCRLPRTIFDTLINCTSNATMCDGIIDCINGVDEIDEDCPKRGYCDENVKELGVYDTERQRCDHIIDCKDTMKDEMNCSRQTHFYCDNGTFIRASQVNDKILDCQNGEDECDNDSRGFSKGQYMMNSTILLILMWITALLALVGNSVIIVISVRDLRVTYHRGATAAVTGRVGACNKILVLNLALADFLMGVYLFVLDIKAAEFSGSYCKFEEIWRSSALCSGLGFIAVLSSQTSVVIMIMMTTYRLYSVRSPFRAEKLKVRYLVVLVLAGWIPPIFIALLPLLSYDKSYAFLTRLPHFTATRVVDQPRFKKFIGDALMLSNSSEDGTETKNWNALMKTFCSLYKDVCTPTTTIDNNPVVLQWYGYYSADSVCLPRLFPRIGDSGWDYTTAIISFDFAAFLYILLAYLLVYKFTVTGSTEHGNGMVSFRVSSYSSVDELRSREDRIIWKRISRLLLTDFLCWIPICLTCLIALMGVEIDPVFYQVSAIVLLPINSALNPLLYSNAISNVIRKWARKLRDILPFGNREGATARPNESRLGANGASNDLQLSGDPLAATSVTVLDGERSRNEDRQPQANDGEMRGETLSPQDLFKKRKNLVKTVTKLFARKHDRRRPSQMPLQEYSAGIIRRPKSQSTHSASTMVTTFPSEESV